MPGRDWDKVHREDRVRRYGSTSVFNGLPVPKSLQSKKKKKSPKSPLTASGSKSGLQGRHPMLGPTRKQLASRSPSEVSLDRTLLRIVTVRAGGWISIGEIVQELRKNPTKPYSVSQVRGRLKARQERFILGPNRVRLRVERTQ